MKLESINTLEDVKTFVNILIKEDNLNFHPDTPFEDYIYIKSGKPFYTKKEAQLRSRLLEEAFQLDNRLEVDVYKIMCDVGFQIIAKPLSGNLA